ncbi:MAG: DUF433 domain-containing protein [Pirellulaceae bacterium]
MTPARADLWRHRITLPSYRVAEAARYARTTPQTIGNWQKVSGGNLPAISERAGGKALSYLQLIEVGVVAAMRESGVKLATIRRAREYLSKEFDREFPFAYYRFKTDGKQILMDYDQLVSDNAKGKLIVVSESGQLAWNQILSGLLREFEYESDGGIVLRWKLGGLESPVSIDPRVAFGAPHVDGIPTWVLKERWGAGESVGDISDDYALAPATVFSALRFEGVNVDTDRPNSWVH